MWNKAQPRELVARVDGNCFYRAMSLWNDTNNLDKSKPVRHISSIHIESKPGVEFLRIYGKQPVKIRWPTYITFDGQQIVTPDYCHKNFRKSVWSLKTEVR